ncbi:structural protein [Cellulophaga phage phi48:2]|uniref:structural protein n=1 Tax=Cellulophaga phage phi48:2 TaxID=1327968 RepID=UPI000351E851|nr:structural protein [Cellulophaga phage phi48:2]AGO47262.1 structural protein [Cellulophaga phage phi48:2]
MIDILGGLKSLVTGGSTIKVTKRKKKYALKVGNATVSKHYTLAAAKRAKGSNKRLKLVPLSAKKGTYTRPKKKRKINKKRRY